MALPKNAKREAQIKLSTFCEERIPERVRDELRLDFNFWGNNVNLVEKRIRWKNKEEWIDIRVAQFRYDPDTERWSLLWVDSNDRLHPYKELVPEFTPEKDLSKLIQEVDDDPTGIFWG